MKPSQIGPQNFMSDEKLDLPYREGLSSRNILRGPVRHPEADHDV